MVSMLRRLGHITGNATCCLGACLQVLHILLGKHCAETWEFLRGWSVCVDVGQQSSGLSLRLNGYRYKPSRCGVCTQLGYISYFGRRPVQWEQTLTEQLRCLKDLKLVYRPVGTIHTEYRYHLLNIVLSEAEMWYRYVASLGHVCPITLTIITAVSFVPTLGSFQYSRFCSPLWSGYYCVSPDGSTKKTKT